MPGQSMEYRKQVFRAVVVLLFLILAGDLFWMTVPRNLYYRGLALENRQVRFRVRAPRGRIFDRRGVLLADNTFIADFTLSRRDFLAGRCDSTIALVCDWFGLDEVGTRSRLQAQAEQTDNRLTLVSNADLPGICAVEEHRRDLPGLLVETRPRRRYLQGTTFAHLIGYVGQIHDAEVSQGGEPLDYRSGDMIGRQGIERAYEAILRGSAGLKLEEVNASGHRVGQTPVWLQEVVPGQDVTLTMAADLQGALAAAIGSQVACGVVLSCLTGEVLAAYSNPTFDPNLLTVPISQANWQRLIGDPDKPFFNRVLQATYPPASLYKPIVELAALKAGIVGQNSVLEPCLGGWQLGNRFFRCWKSSGHGRLNQTDALVHSCDTNYYQIGLQMDIDTLAKAARSFGLGARRSGVFTEEVTGLVPDRSWYDEHFGPGRWSRGVVLNNSIGQGELLVTPLQMAIVAGQLATAGGMPTPTFVGGQTKLDPLPQLPFAKDDLEWIKAALRQVVTRGTGQAANMPDVEVAGKTGTAQNPHGEDHAWFMCYAPAEAPEIAMAVIVENAGHGGSVAAPVARKWLEYYFHNTDRSSAQEALPASRKDLP